MTWTRRSRRSQIVIRKSWTTFRSALADVLEEDRVRGLLIDACLFLREQLPEEGEVVGAKRARIEAHEFQQGDMSAGVKCAMSVAAIGFGGADIVTTGGAVSSIVLGGASQLSGFVIGWDEGCRTLVKRIWSRLRG